MIPPEDQEREGGESAETMGALETLLLSLGAGSLIGLTAYAPKAVNKAAAALRRAANKAVSENMADVEKAVERDLVGVLVLEAVTDADHLGEGKRRSKIVKAARAEGRKAARQAQRRIRKYAACMVDDLNAKFLREAARARSRMLGGAGADGVNHRKAMAEAVARMAKDGLTAYTYERKDGAIVHVPVDVGVRRELQSAGAERQIDQVLAIAAVAGENMVEVSTTAGARKSHAEWQGKRYLIKGSSAKYPNFAKACKKGDPVDGIGGYNCRHQVAICREGEPSRFRDPLKGTGYTQERARAALTAQRGMENDLRRLRRQREVLRMNGLSTKEINAKIKALDKGLDEFVAQHSKILKRDRHRESIYERARKAVGAEGQVWLSDDDMSKVTRMAGIAEGRSKQRAYSTARLVEKCSKSETTVFLNKRKANDKAFHRNMKRVEKAEGFYDVGLHGTPQYVEAFGERMDYKSLWKAIRAREDYDGQGIRLLSCGTGSEDDKGFCFAQALADYSGKTVEAPSDKIWIMPDGRLLVGESWLRPDGIMRVFEPREKS